MIENRKGLESRGVLGKGLGMGKFGVYVGVKVL